MRRTLEPFPDRGSLGREFTCARGDRDAWVDEQLKRRARDLGPSLRTIALSVGPRGRQQRIVVSTSAKPLVSRSVGLRLRSLRSDPVRDRRVSRRGEQLIWARAARSASQASVCLRERCVPISYATTTVTPASFNALAISPGGSDFVTTPATAESGAILIRPPRPNLDRSASTVIERA